MPPLSQDGISGCYSFYLTTRISALLPLDRYNNPFRNHTENSVCHIPRSSSPRLSAGLARLHESPRCLSSPNHPSRHIPNPLPLSRISCPSLTGLYLSARRIARDHCWY